MPEHFCKDCKNDGDNVCKFTGASHDTGIECPSFEPKEVEMFKVGDEVKITTNENQLKERQVGNLCVAGKTGAVTAIRNKCITVAVDIENGSWEYYERDLELVKPEPAFALQPEEVLEVKDTLGHVEGHDPLDNPDAEVIRTFATGATRDTTQGKLDYVKALSPIVLRRYVQYLDKHRLQPDGSYRDFDNWKKGIPQEAYISGGGRHFWDTWLLTDGYTTEDNHGPVEIEDAICAQLFNLMGRLHEMLRPGVADRAAPVEGGY